MAPLRKEVLYEVQWDYESSLGGPMFAGQIIRMFPEEAEAFNNDSPGVLVHTGVKTKATPRGKTRQIISASKRGWSEEMSVDELREACKERGLKVRGLKSELIDRLNEFEGEEEDDDRDL